MVRRLLSHWSLPHLALKHIALSTIFNRTSGRFRSGLYLSHATPSVSPPARKLHRSLSRNGPADAWSSCSNAAPAPPGAIPGHMLFSIDDRQQRELWGLALLSLALLLSLSLLPLEWFGADNAFPS